MAKTVLVTGASAGFGLAIARRFAKEGHRVILTGRRRERLDEIKAELGDGAHVLVFDVADYAAVKAAIESLPAEFAQIDVLVNNAGLALGLDKVWEGNVDEWHTMVDTNIKGLLHVTRLVLPGMVERDAGHVINIGSVAGTYPYAGGNVYGGTKAFVHQFSLNMRADLAGKHIKVTNIEPGMVQTDFSLVRFKGDAERANSVYANFENITADDIAEAVYWVATCPVRMNINTMEIMPVMQSFAGFQFTRTPGAQ